jgi:biopolymer transport protein ExbD
MSNKLRSLNGKTEDEAKMDMSPMIDMVFLLLVFFIVVSTPMVVKMDAEVAPSVAYNAKKPEQKHGRIVVNVRSDGTIYPVEVTDGPLETEDDIIEYVEKFKTEFVNQGFKPRLHLRGDKDSVFKHSRKVIKASAAAGVDSVIFSAFDFEK